MNVHELVDNAAEFKRSAELEAYLARTYETNYLINICEYVEVLDQDDFFVNEAQIKQILTNMSENYLFDDIGFQAKNSYNWGKREAELTDDEKREYGSMADDVYDVVILDYGYLYPIRDQKKELMRCPKCHHQLRWNSTFTSLTCTAVNCGLTITPTQLRSRMKKDYENLEEELMSSFNDIKMPNLVTIERELAKMIKKGEKK